MTVAQDAGTSVPAGMVELGARPSLGRYLRQVWQRRDFVVALPLGQLSARNADTFLGGAWHLLNPLMLAGAYYLIFGVLFEGRRDVDNFAGFLLVGIFVFHYTSKVLTSGAKTIAANRGLIRSINMPRAVFPLGAVVGETLAHLPALGVLLGLLLITGEPVRATWALLPLIVLLQAVFNLGLALLMGRLTFQFGDVRNMLPFVTRLWLYLSGVFFVADRVPEGVLRTLFDLNPLQVYISVNRSLLLGGVPEPRTWVLGGAWALVLLVVGLVSFWSAEQSYARE